MESRGHASGGGVWGRRRSPQKANRLNRFQSSRASNLCGASILVRHHQGDGGLRVVHVERAASGDEFHQPGGAVVVADIQGDGDAVNTWASADDPETGHPDNNRKASDLPKPIKVAPKVGLEPKIGAVSLLSIVGFS